jgi:hypothetical protein
MKATTSFFIVLFGLAVIHAPLWAQERATPQEVLQKVTEARDFLSASGQAGIAEFNQKDSRWVWKDTYVFVMDLDTVVVLAHPMNPKLLGRDQIGLKDIKGNFLFIQFCEKAAEDGGGWVEYWWPKPGQQTPSRKVTYVLRVPGTTLVVGAGVYDETMSIDELNRLVKK